MLTFGNARGWTDCYLDCLDCHGSGFGGAEIRRRLLTARFICTCPHHLFLSKNRWSYGRGMSAATVYKAQYSGLSTTIGGCHAPTARGGRGTQLTTFCKDGPLLASSCARVRRMADLWPPALGPVEPTLCIEPSQRLAFARSRWWPLPAAPRNPRRLRRPSLRRCR